MNNHGGHRFEIRDWSFASPHEPVTGIRIKGRRIEELSKEDINKLPYELPVFTFRDPGTLIFRSRVEWKEVVEIVSLQCEQRDRGATPLAMSVIGCWTVVDVPFCDDHKTTLVWVPYPGTYTVKYNCISDGVWGSHDVTFEC